MRQCYTKEGKAETPLTHPLCVPAGRYELEAPSKLTRVQTSLSTRLRFNTVRFVVSETKIDELTLPRHSYSIIGRPIQSLLSQRTAKSGCLSPCKRARGFLIRTHRSYAHWKPRLEASDPRQRQVHAALFTFAEAQSEFSA